MKTQTRTQYQAPKLEVQRLRDLPSALAQSGCKKSSPNSPTCSNSTANHSN